MLSILKPTIIAAGLALGFTGAASAATSTLIDFTDRSQWSGKGAGATYFVDYGWFTVTLDTNPSDSVNFNQNFDGPKLASYCQLSGGPLACQSDGLGIQDDEITAPLQSATLTFSRALDISGLHFLDLFFKPNPQDPTDFENAGVSVNGGAPIFFEAIQPLEQFGGYLFAAVNWTGVTSLSFFARPGYLDDGIADFSLAGIQVIPLPAGGLLLITALGGMALLRRRKQAAA